MEPYRGTIYKGLTENKIKDAYMLCNHYRIVSEEHAKEKCFEDSCTLYTNKNEENILENSNLNGVDELPNAVDQEDALDKKKQQRERFGSVNLKADEETNKYETEIKKMESDRIDLVTAIIKLNASANADYENWLTSNIS